MPRRIGNDKRHAFIASHFSKRTRNFKREGASIPFVLPVAVQDRSWPLTLPLGVDFGTTESFACPGVEAVCPGLAGGWGC